MSIFQEHFKKSIIIFKKREKLFGRTIVGIYVVRVDIPEQRSSHILFNIFFVRILKTVFSYRSTSMRYVLPFIHSYLDGFESQVHVRTCSLNHNLKLFEHNIINLDCSQK